MKQSTSSPSPSGALSCAICSDISDGLHFGVFTCRACAAFFRRTVSLRLEYVCRAQGECSIDTSARNMCRSCRFQICIERGMKITAVQQARDGIGKRKDKSEVRLHSPSSDGPTSSTDLHIQPSYSQMSFSSFKSAFTAPQETIRPLRLLSKMQEGYTHFLTIRKATHSMVDTQHVSPLFQNTMSELRRSNFDSAKKVCQLEAHLVTDIINTYFQPFDQLPFEEKVILFKNFFCYLSHTDRAYQSYKMFGQDEANDRLLMPDGGYIKSSELELFYANAQGVHSQPEEAAKIFRPAMDFILNVIIAHMRRIEIAELEYVAILGFFLWNEAVPGLSPATIEMIHQTQAGILSDLHTHYRQMNLDGSCITRKTGQLMLLLPKLTRSVVMLRENSELAELFNIFEADVCCKSFKGDEIKLQ